MRIEKKSSDYFSLKFNYGDRQFHNRLSSKKAAWSDALHIMEAMQNGDQLTIMREEKSNEPTTGNHQG